ncbi:MAG: CcmD family protein [Bacteroidota bacterium]
MMFQGQSQVNDTLTQAYSEKWSGVDEIEQSGAVVQFMSSNDLIFVVLGVTLIIWFVLLYFVIRVDKKVTDLETQLSSGE